MKSIFLVIVCLFLSVELFAQDTIIFKSGMRVVAKVEEINKGEIKYRKFDNITGPLIIVERNDVNKIKYTNGTTEEIMVTLPPTSNLIMTDSVLLHKSNIVSVDMAQILFKRLSVGYEFIVAHGYLGLGANTYFAIADDAISFQQLFANNMRETHGAGLGLKFYPTRAQKNGLYVGVNFDFMMNNYKSFNAVAYNRAYQNYVSQMQSGGLNYNPPNTNNFTVTKIGQTYKTAIGLGLFTSPVNNLYLSADWGIGFAQNVLPGYLSTSYFSDESQGTKIHLRAALKIGYRFGNDKRERAKKPVNIDDYKR